MAIETKTMGYIQIIGGLVALWAAWKGNFTLAIGIVALIFLAMGYHHAQAKGHKTF